MDPGRRRVRMAGSWDSKHWGKERKKESLGAEQQMKVPADPGLDRIGRHHNSTNNKKREESEALAGDVCCCLLRYSCLS